VYNFTRHFYRASTQQSRAERDTIAAFPSVRLRLPVHHTLVLYQKR